MSFRGGSIRELFRAARAELPPEITLEEQTVCVTCDDPDCDLRFRVSTKDSRWPGPFFCAFCRSTDGKA